MSFSFATAAEIHFGRGTARIVPEAASRFSDRAMLVHGRDGARSAWLAEDLKNSGVGIVPIACPGEPDLKLVEAAVDVAREARPGVVIAVGGGSVIDLGKAVAALAPARDRALAYLEVVGEGRALTADPLPFIAIPTTAGTGAEVTKNAVIGVPDHRRKVSLRDARMIPDIAIVDPALTDGAPRSVTFSSGLDAVTQVIEPFLSTRACPLTDALCADAIPRGLRALLRLHQTEDPAARDDMALTSLFGGIALANAGLGAVHGLAGVIGGRTGAPHGAICAALLPRVLEVNAEALPVEDKLRRKLDRVFAWIADALEVRDEDATQALAMKIAEVGIPDLAKLGVTEGDMGDIALAARAASSSKSNPVPPDRLDFEEILRRSLKS